MLARAPSSVGHPREGHLRWGLFTKLGGNHDTTSGGVDELLIVLMRLALLLQLTSVIANP